MAYKKSDSGMAAMPSKLAKAAPVGRPRGSNKEERLATILVIARKQFSEKGYSQTTFRDVAQEAGMTHAALYSYFSSKADLYLATLIDTQEILMPEYWRAIKECKTLTERFRRIAMASAAVHDRDSTVTGFLAAVSIEIRRHPELNIVVNQNNAVFSALTAMFEEAKRNGEISASASTENLISALYGGAMGVALMKYGMRSPIMSDAMDVFVTIIECGVETLQRAHSAAAPGEGPPQVGQLQDEKPATRRRTVNSMTKAPRMSSS